MIDILKTENETVLKQLSDLLHCCFFLHAGYPDLYDPILEALKVRVRDCCNYRQELLHSKQSILVATILPEQEEYFINANRMNFSYL